MVRSLRAVDMPGMLARSFTMARSSTSGRLHRVAGLGTLDRLRTLARLGTVENLYRVV